MQYAASSTCSPFTFGIFILFYFLFCPIGNILYSSEYWFIISVQFNQFTFYGFWDIDMGRNIQNAFTRVHDLIVLSVKAGLFMGGGGSIQSNYVENHLGVSC